MSDEQETSLDAEPTNPSTTVELGQELFPKGFMHNLERIPDVEIQQVIISMADDFWVDWTWRGISFTANYSFGAYPVACKPTAEAACFAEMCDLLRTPPLRKALRHRMKSTVSGCVFISVPAGPSLWQRLRARFSR